MPTDWKEWDRTSAILGALQYRTTEIKRNLGEMSVVLDAMRARPCFETEAQAALDTLEADLLTSLASVRVLKDQYERIAAVA